MYSWEIAFRRIIQSLREKEIFNYKKLALNQSLIRAFANSIGYLAAFVMFVVSYYAQTGLTIVKMFSIIEVTANFRFAIFVLLASLGFFFEVKVVFGRFANIFNI